MDNLNREKLIKQSILIASISMFIGCFIYIFLRPVEALGVKELVSHLRIIKELREYTTQYRLSNWILYSLPNGLWTFSYSLIIFSIWLGVRTKEATIWLVTIPIVGFTYEIFQYLDIIKGTFCTDDMIYSLIGILLSFSIIKIKLWRGTK